MNSIFKSLSGGSRYSPAKPKRKKYTVLGCEASGEVVMSFPTDSKSDAESVAKSYPLANVIGRGRTSIFENGKRIIIKAK